jgi:UDP-4-amino-4,6-dideoxy-N-acetyl-beta-L-altrosamine transaminase
MIPYGRQDIDDADIEAVSAVLRSDYLTQGPCVPKFEAIVSSYVGAKYAVAVNSATSALHIACLALDLGPDDWLWTSPITFVASANAALYCGAKVDFVDIDPATYNMCLAELEKKLETAKRSGRLPKIVVPVHMCGQPCDMAGIAQLSKRYGFRVIEDASHAIGGKYRNEFVGNCMHSDITIFSYHPVKIVTTAEGGMALTNSAALASRMQLLRSHGITRDLDADSTQYDGPWQYEQIDLGFNYRMTDMQAALGISQMSRIDSYVRDRHTIARRYDVLLESLSVLTPAQCPDSYSAYHLYVIRVPCEGRSSYRRDIFERMRAADIGVNVHYIPVHTQPYYRKMGFAPGDFPNAEHYYSEAISLPMYPKLTAAQQDYVVTTLAAALLE